MEAVIFFEFFASCRRYVNKAVRDGTSLIIRSDYGNAVLMAEDEYKCLMKMAHESIDLKIELNKYGKNEKYKLRRHKNRSFLSVWHPEKFIKDRVAAQSM